MGDLLSAVRILAIWSAGACVCVLLPLLWFLRRLAACILYKYRISIWTGAPVLTLGLNCHVEKSLGFNSLSIVPTTYYITNKFDYVISRIARGSRVAGFILSYLSFLFVCVSAKQVHGYFDGGLLPSAQARNFSLIELFAYRFLGIRLFTWTYGGDVRSRGITIKQGEPNCCTDCIQVGVACICVEEARVANVERVRDHATAMFAMGDMIEYTPGSRNDLFFWPVDLDADDKRRYRPCYPISDASKPLRVVHAPNHRQFKGTVYLEKAVRELQLKGVPIELVMVERVPNEQALEIYRSADVVFDQCLIGFHGYFALEAMALGKPVMCFIRKPDKYLLHPEECPIIRTHVDTVKADLIDLVTNRQYLETIGRQGRNYIEKYYTMEAFARRLTVAYKDLGICI